MRSSIRPYLNLVSNLSDADYRLTGPRTLDRVRLGGHRQPLLDLTRSSDLVESPVQVEPIETCLIDEISKTFVQ